MSRDDGKRWERSAERYLERRGLRTVARNHRCRSGEVDLIMLDGETLCFIEVRYRRSARFGSGADSVDRHKRRRLVSAAGQFLGSHGQWNESPCRFDVVSVGGGLWSRICWVKNAFSADDS